MLSPDALYCLIHSLSSSEKRYFKIFAARHAGETQNKYVDLFDLMEQTPRQEVYIKKRRKGEVYDESIFLGTKSAQNKRDLAVQKNILYPQILRSLRYYNDGKSVKIQLRNFLTEIDFLLKKDLIEQAQKRLQVAKKLALDYQYEIILYEIILIERQIIRRFETKNITEQLQVLNAESLSCLKTLYQQQEILEIYEPLHVELRNKRNIETEEVELMREKSLSILKTFEKTVLQLETSFNTKISYYLLAYNYYYTIKCNTEAYEALSQIIDLFEKNKKMIVEEPERYIRFLHNFLNVCITSKKHEEIEPTIEKIQNVFFSKELGGLGVKDFHLQLQVFKTTSFSLLRHYLLHENFNAAINLIEKIRKELDQYEAHLSIAWLIPFYHNISMTLFLRHQYSDALFWTTKVAMMDNKNVKINIQLFSRILHVILNYEVGNHAIIANSLIPSLRREFNKKKASVALQSYLPEFVLLLKAIKKACNTYQKAAIFQKTYEELLLKWNGPEFKEIMEWIKQQGAKAL